MPGRPIKPTALKLVQGTARPGRLNTHEPQYPIADDLTPPAGLSEKAKAHWALIAEQLKEAGVLTRIDRDALCGYCESYTQWQEAQAHIAKNGALIKNPKTGFPEQSPLIFIAEKAFKQWLSLAREFGLSPASRARIQAAPKQEDENPFANIRRKNK